MSDNNAQSRLVSYEQVKSIIDFMAQHVEFASGSLRSLEARHTSKRLWEELAKILNSCRGGTRKTTDGWSKYWSDFKNKLKNKVWLLKRKKAGNSLKGIRPLTKLEKRALAILGPYYEKKKSRDADSQMNNMHPKVKLESIHETVHVNSFSKSNNGNTLSGGEDESDDSAESYDGEYTNDNDPNVPALQSIYPKWLIEVEKKRADAELIRAKAEEQRAVVAAKTAEASLLQAEALRRLADAATSQAEAIMRIAGVLESRAQRNSMLDL
ncbi:unnamed protein product [Spodoptera exigua]|uniref:Regulatory protein zeste n=1 Tax=Spodoptera exigua TaxID=7107 RepID=A0A835GE49_SPOEX|nr:hypothetical protein HW555_008900 [Spodoptera exigua]KAH9640563.1 hypothetical protein HF086_000507 [Spodoptera exigua]CAH0699388.1 unnamed protein product [Spodoptera exigua]